MRLFRAPGVYAPRADTGLLIRALSAAAIPHGAKVVDVCTGTGAVAIEAGRAGAAAVTAVDISRRALASAWLNSRLQGVPLELLHGDFGRVLRRRTFDAVLANPPYVPGPATTTPRGRARAWEAGPHGRALLDPLCRLMPELLRAKGMALIVHSSLCDPELTVRQLRDGGLKAAVVVRETCEFGPVLNRRAEWLEAQRLIEPGTRQEELVVIRADRE
ncbi:methyltransferase [Nocardia veterana]|uniref:Methyltransferase n=1 Tax=Nocardia veterana TaxID=132249 RepID=A0A7X6M237_9NOCA|nr:methyltransferase [Nocardia veterana]NKY88394.1 methyltransferase [Nocardia veterana]